MNNHDLRALVAEMAHEGDHARQLLLGDRTLTDPLADRARALLAQPEPQPPAADEVAGIAAWLRRHCDDANELGRPDWGHMSARAAELLQRLAPLQPIPVSERLPGAGDCIRHGDDDWCWGQVRSVLTGHGSANWRLMRVSALRIEAVAWLPAHALPLPLPSGEAK